MEQRVNKDGFWKVLSVVLLLVLVGVVAWTVWQGRQPHYVYYERGANSAPSKLAALAPSLKTDQENIYWIADLAEQALPYVVHVETMYKQEDDGQVRSLHEEMQRNMPHLFPFGDQEFQWQTPEMPQDYQPSGEGSGFIFREDGYIVTNAHVVNDMDENGVKLKADKFVIHMYNGETYDAKLIGTDNFKDIAVLKIDAGKDLPVAVLGHSGETRIGEPVVAIGSPLGYEATLTAGIVSSNYRDPESVHRPADVRRPQYLIQTDAAINQGNSGGPLINANGEVIGINQAIVRWQSEPTFWSMSAVPVEGIGFAIPIDEVKSTVEQIVTNGKVVYPGISAVITSLEDYLKNEPNLKLELEKGVYVVSVTVGGPADRAGLEAGDVILAINDVDVTTADQLISEIQLYKVGDRVTLRVARQGGKKQENVTVVLGELDLSEVQVE